MIANQKIGVSNNVIVLSAYITLLKPNVLPTIIPDIDRGKVRKRAAFM